MALPYTTIKWADNPIVWKNNITRLNAQNMNLISNALTDISDVLLGDNNDGLINQSCRVYEQVIGISDDISQLNEKLRRISETLSYKVGSVNGKSGSTVTVTGADIPLEEGSQTIIGPFVTDLSNKFVKLNDDLEDKFTLIENTLDSKVSSVNGKNGTVTVTGADIPLEEGSQTLIAPYINSINSSVLQINEKLSNKADVETGTCDLIIKSSNMFSSEVVKTCLLDWDLSKNFYTNGTAVKGETLNVTGTSRMRIIGSYNNDCTGATGITFDAHGSGTLKLEVTDNNGTNYSSSGVVLSSSSTTVTFYFEEHGFTDISNLEINLQMAVADEAFDVTVTDIMMFTDPSTQHITGAYSIIGNKVEVNFKLTDIVNPGVFTVTGLPHAYPARDQVFTCSGYVIMSDGVPIDVKPSLCCMYEDSDHAVVYSPAVEESMPFTLAYEF